MQYTLTKYNATGNIFLLARSSSRLNTLRQKRVYSNLAWKMCAPMTGVGADGLLVISPSTVSDFSLDVFNADGSWAERSGNGLRASVAYAQKGSPRRKRWSIATGNEIVAATILRKSTSGEAIVSTEVGRPVYGLPPKADTAEEAQAELQELRIGKQRVKYVPVSIGNPHAVVLVKAFPRNWVELGSRIAGNKRFKNGVNVEFVKIITSGSIEIRIFERGVGPTGSSGTGACASVAVLRSLGKVSAKVRVVSSRQLAPTQKSALHQLTVFWKDMSQPIVVSGNVKELHTAQVTI